MFNPYLLEADVAWRTTKVREDYAAAQRPVTLQGFRAVIGHTFIRIGSRIEGTAREACEGCAETGRSLATAGPISLIR